MVKISFYQIRIFYNYSSQKKKKKIAIIKFNTLTFKFILQKCEILGSRFQILRTGTCGCGVSSSGLCVFHCSNSSSNPLRSSLFLHIQYLITSLQIYYIQLCCKQKDLKVAPIVKYAALSLFFDRFYPSLSRSNSNFFTVLFQEFDSIFSKLTLTMNLQFLSQLYLFTVLLPLLFVLSFQLLHYIMIAYIVEDFVQFFLKLHCI